MEEMMDGQMSWFSPATSDGRTSPEPLQAERQRAVTSPQRILDVDAQAYIRAV